MAKKKKDNGNISKPKLQNLAAKHSHNMTGAGQHVDKRGENAPRTRQKKQWKKEMNESPLITQANTELQYDNSDDFGQALKNVESQFGINLSEGFTPQQTADMEKIIDHYGSSFFRDGTAEQVGNDLEMLDYDPNEIEPMVGHVMAHVERMWQEQGK